MNTEQFEQLQKELSAAISKRDRAAGAIEQIETEWREKFKLNSFEEVSEKLDEINKQIKELEEKYQKLLDDAKKLMESQNDEQ